MRAPGGGPALLLLLALVPAGCGGGPPRTGAGRGSARDVGAPVEVTLLADSAESAGLPPARRTPVPPAPRVTLVRIALARSDVAPPLPVPESGAWPPGDAPREGLAADDALRPPLLREPLALRAPQEPAAVVELDVRVDERGVVTDVRPAAGDAGPAAVAAAVEAARRARWYPATLHGRPVAVWCRQRFEPGASRDRREGEISPGR